MAKLPRPDGHHSITPSFVVPNVAKVIAFTIKAFGAKVVDKYEGPNGTIMHAEIMIGDSVVMCGEPSEEVGTTPAYLSYYVDDGDAVDATYKKALECGATSISEPKNQFYGYRAACVKDMGGNRWTICAVVETLTRAEIDKRMSEMMKG